VVATKPDRLAGKSPGMPEPNPSDVNLPDTSSQDAAVAAALRRGADVSDKSNAHVRREALDRSRS